GLAMALITSCYSCAHKDSSGRSGTQTEVWEMVLTGGTVAQYKMLVNRKEIGKDVYGIEGEFSGYATEHKMYRGMVKCNFHGKITGNDLKGDFSGTGRFAIDVHIVGSFWGTVSDTEGKGKYTLTHDDGGSEGEFTLKRIKNTNARVPSSDGH
ncbi:MAG: hypothetical protein ACXWL9_05050, partial [Syntrophales bacterium]